MGGPWCPVALAIKRSVVNLIERQVGLEARSDCGGWKNEWGVRSQTPLGQGINLIVLVSSVPCIIPGTWCLLH